MRLVNVQKTIEELSAIGYLDNLHEGDVILCKKEDFFSLHVFSDNELKLSGDIIGEKFAREVAISVQYFKSSSYNE